MITSGIFWLVLLGSVLVYWFLPRGKEWFLSAVSLAYVVWLDALAAGLVVGWSGAIYWACQVREGGIRARSSWPAVPLIGGVLVCLGYFKYAPAIVAAVTGTREVAVASVVVPFGISYFTFKLIAYVLDAVRRVLPPHSPRQFALYMLFFPIFGAGPIERFEPFSKNAPRPFRRDLFGEGLTRIVYGLIKKLVVVDILLSRVAGPQLDFHWWVPHSLDDVLSGDSSLRAWQFVANRTLAGYLDFSAYSDIAIGGALLFGYRIGENFDYPIFAVSIGDFWKRWHISLSSFCQRYVYMPVVGKTRSPYLSIVATMLAVALWHAGTLNMVVWGAGHAALLCGFQAWGRIRRRRRWTLDFPGARAMGWALTMTAVVAVNSFMATSDAGIRQGFRLFGRLFGVT